MNYDASNVSPNHSPWSGRGSENSFGKMYSQSDDAIFLQRRDENKGDVAESFSQRGEDATTEKSQTDRDDDDDDDDDGPFLPQGKPHPNSVERRNKAPTVTFGSVSFCEFKVKDAPILMSPEKISEKFAPPPVNRVDSIKRPPAPIRLPSLIQFAQLKIPDQTRKTGDGDRQPRLPVRTSDNATAA